MKTYKKLVFILLFTGLINGHVISQQSSAVFGKVTEEELNMKAYEKDQTAEAVVLSDIGKAYFDQSTSGSFDLVFERTVKIKILSKPGIKWAEVEIPFYQDKNQKEIIEYINAYTANFEDNRIRKSNVDSENIYEEKATEHWYVKKFAFPNVQVGSVIECNYKIISPFKFNMRDWEFQNRIPVVYSEYEVRMNPFYEYTFLLQGRVNFDEHTSHQDQNSRQYGTIEYYDMISKFIMRDLPAFNDETYITSINDHIIKLDFQLSKITRTDGISIDVFTSWPTVCNELLRYNDFGKYMSSIKGTAKKIVEELALDDLTPEEKIKVIVDYVKSNFTWNGYKSKYASKKAKEFISEKTGNCAEINLFVVTLLNEAGIEAYPVLISTRDQGKIKVDYPFVQFFNYTIAMARLAFDIILIDGSEAVSAYNEIPPRCFNNKGLVVYKKSEEWVGLVPGKPSLRKYDFDIDLTSNHESAITTGTIKYDGIDAIIFRRKYLNNEKLEEYITDMGFTHVESVSSPNLTDRNLPLKVIFDAKAPLEQLENKVLISPFFSAPISENPLKQETRKYPIDMIYKNENVFQSEITIPDNMKVVSLPKDENIDNKNIRITYTAQILNKNKIVINGYYSFKNTVYSEKNYNSLKYYFNLIISKLNEKILLEMNENLY